MEAAAALHVPPSIRSSASRSRRAAATGPGTARPATTRRCCAPLVDGEVAHWVRLYDVLPGHSRIDGGRPVGRRARAHGARRPRGSALALRGFTHPRAVRRDALGRPARARRRERCSSTSATRDGARVVDARARRVRRRGHAALAAAAGPGRRTPTSPSTTRSPTTTGSSPAIIDFGDMSHTALITDLASVLDSLGGGRTGDELFRARPARARRLPAADPAGGGRSSRCSARAGRRAAR